MALVVCPDCGNKISQHADICPSCGFPLNKIMKEKQINDLTKTLICPKCGLYTYINEFSKENCIKITCKHCNSFLCQTDMSPDEWESYGWKEFNNGNEDYLIDLAKKYGNNQFDNELYTKWKNKHTDSNVQEQPQHNQQTTQSNITRCPHCGGTAFTPVKRKFSILAGFATNKVDLVCNNCGRVVKPK